jgi:hypothetical protein
MDELHSEFDKANPLGTPPSVLSTGISALGTRISFTVPDALPPQKNGGSSMWGRQIQVVRLIRLRQVARVAFGDRAPFQGPVMLKLFIFLRPPPFRLRTGDLDAYAGGVFDALKGASPTTRLSPLWAAQAPDDDPYAPIAFLDDAQVVHLVAEKRASGAGEGLEYEVTVQSTEC